MTEQSDQGGPVVDATLTDQGETKPLIDETQAAEGATQGASGATDEASSETAEPEDRPHPDPVMAPPGFVKTMDLRVNGQYLEQRWVSGHDANAAGVWVPIDGQ